MNKKDLNEGPIRRGLARGFQAGQAGGALGPDSAERFIKGIFTKAPDEKPSKEPEVKAKPAATPKEKPSQQTIRDFNRIPDMVAFKDNNGMLFTYDQSQKKWVSRDGKSTLDPKQGAVAYNQAREKSKLESEDVTMKKNVKEGLAELAQQAEHDHEVQMARADLYKIAKYAIKLHDMLKGVSETEGLEGWQQAKITKASDYISSVYHNLDYDMKFKNNSGELGEGKSPHKKGSSAYKKQMAAKHANMKESNDPYKKKLAERLAKKIS
jgi:hypothetical protein